MSMPISSSINRESRFARLPAHNSLFWERRSPIAASEAGIPSGAGARAMELYARQSSGESLLAKASVRTFASGRSDVHSRGAQAGSLCGSKVRVRLGYRRCVRSGTVAHLSLAVS
jgi:hypothetical protein